MKYLLASIAVLFLAQAATAQFIDTDTESDFSLDLGNRDGGFTIDLNALNKRSYSFDFHIQVPDLEGVTDDQALQDLEISTRLGQTVHHRVLIEGSDKEYILGSLVDGRKVRVSSFNEENDIPQIAFSVTDENQRRLSNIEDDEFVVFDNGRQECFNFQRAYEADLDVSVGIAIDISGSMSGFENLLNRSVQTFAKSVDSNAVCSVVEFNHEYEVVVGGDNQRVRCDALGNFQISQITGGTTAFPAIERVYDLVQQQKSDLELVLVISDGVSNSTGFADALSRKSDTTTFVNWLGNYRKDYPLADFADAEIFGSFEQNASLPDFFDAASQTISGQFVARPCGF